MSKLDIGVGEEFLLDEPSDDGRHAGRHRHTHHHRDHHHGHGRHHHRRHGLGRLAGLLMIAGLAGLIVEHRLSAGMAYGLIGAGVGLAVLTVLLRAVFHWRHHRRIHQQVS